MTGPVLRAGSGGLLKPLRQAWGAAEVVALVHTVAFSGIDVCPIEVQVQIAGGLPAFSLVGLPDKAVAESRERVCAALVAIGLGMPPKRITINLAPADMLKEGSYFDLPIALGILSAMGLIPAEELLHYTAVGELALDGRISALAGVLPAAISAHAHERGLICPAAQGAEAAWTGGHNMLMVGPPGAGKSMLARRLPGLLPPPSATEALAASMVHSIAGNLPDGGLIRHRPFRSPHPSCSIAAMVGGGLRARPGEISLAHLGVLFLDELPEFPRAVLESGAMLVARANRHVTHPARVQLIGAMNPCRCGHLNDPAPTCRRAPLCAEEYQYFLSGPFLDRIDLHVEVIRVDPWEQNGLQPGESSAVVAARVAVARDRQQARFLDLAEAACNAELDGRALEERVPLSAAAFKLSARGHHRAIKVARTIADLAGDETVSRPHLSEALSYRRRPPHGRMTRR